MYDTTEEMLRSVIREELSAFLTRPGDEVAVSLPEMASILSVSASTVLSMVAREQIHGFRAGRVWRFYPSQVRAELTKPKSRDPWEQSARSKAAPRGPRAQRDAEREEGMERVRVALAAIDALGAGGSREAAGRVARAAVDAYEAEKHRNATAGWDDPKR